MLLAGLTQKTRIFISSFLHFFAAFVAVALFVIPFSCAYADEMQDERTFTQQISVDTPVLHVGEQVSVDLKLTCQNFEAYPMYAYASTLRVNTNMVRIDGITLRQDVDVSTISNIDVDGQSGWTNIIINYRSRSLLGSIWQREETVVTLAITPLVTGNTAIATSRVNVSNATGMSRMPCTCIDLPIAIDESLPIAVLASQYTSASGFSLVSYEGSVPVGNVPQYKDCLFVWDGARFVALIEANDIPYTLSTDFSFRKEDADLVIFGDVNDNGIVNIVDAQIAYDVARGRFAGFSELPLKGWISCDMNKDGLVDAADAYAIQVKVLSCFSEQSFS